MSLSLQKFYNQAIIYLKEINGKKEVFINVKMHNFSILVHIRQLKCHFLMERKRNPAETETI